MREKDPDDFYLKIFCYLQAVAILGLALAIWFLSMYRNQELEKLAFAIEQNNQMIHRIAIEVTNAKMAQENWQEQALKQIRRAVETGQW